MEVPHFKAVALAGLCMSLPIKVWRLRGVLAGVEVPFGPLYLTCAGARIIVRVMEFSL